MQLRRDAGVIGSQPVVVSRKGALLQVIAVEAAPAVAHPGVHPSVALQRFRSLADLAFQLLVAADRHVEDLDGIEVDGRQRLALHRRQVIAIADSDGGVCPVDQFRRQRLPQAVA